VLMHDNSSGFKAVVGRHGEEEAGSKRGNQFRTTRFTQDFIQDFTHVFT